MVLESNLLTLGKEQLKDRDQLRRVDISSAKLQEDIKVMLQNLHSDYQSRLEAKGTEMVNRIIMEHEQRVKVQEETRQSIEVQFKMNNERLQYEREETRERVAAVEQTFRADSQRKEEALRQLSALVETQVNAIYINLRNEEAQRSAHEVALRNDLLKIQENIKQENELFKQHQATITEKMTDMIKVEVQNRLSSDVDLKNLTSAIATDIVADLNSLKDVIDQQNKKYSLQIKDIEKDSSEKAEKLSRYLDDEIAKIQSVQVRKYEKTKIIFTKLAE